MSDSNDVKSGTGPSFARNQLEKYGWEKGKGLGKTESGITDAIKPKLKFDTAGVGHNAGEQFSFHWWDHVFNQAAKNIEVEQSEDGVMVKQRGKKRNLISNKRNAQKAKPKALLYGSFVKHGTLKPDGLVSQNDPSSSSSSDDSDPEDIPPDSHEGNDERLFKACGGRTAHKGARHGLHLSGKLKRIEEQENLHKVVEKTGLGCDQREKKNRKELKRIEEQENLHKDEEKAGLGCDKQGKKKKRKESPEFCDHQMLCAEVENGEDSFQKEEEDGQAIIEDVGAIVGKKKQGKKKKRNKEKKCPQSEHYEFDNHDNCDDKLFSGHSVEENLDKTADSENVKRKKKHKREYLDSEKERFCARDGDSLDDSSSGHMDPVKKKRKKNRKREIYKSIPEEDIALDEDKTPNHHKNEKQKRKKKKNVGENV